MKRDTFNVFPRHKRAKSTAAIQVKQEETLQRLEAFLGFPLGRIIVRTDSIGRWKTDGEQHTFDFFRDAMDESGYTE